MKVLLADDDPLYARVLRSLLAGWGYDVVAVADGSAAWLALSGDQAPRLALLDWVMPGLDGQQVCQELRARPGEWYTYVILLTAKGEKNDLVLGLEAGADDYLVKPFEPAELKARLRTGRRILELQDQLIAAREAMRQQATRDGLTGTCNRLAVLEALGREWHGASREHSPLSILLIDLDDFKRINDTHGHLAGDEVIREAARRMEIALRPYDVLGRYGGEEFLAVLPACDEHSAVRLAERLRARISERPVLHEGEAIPVTGSIGVATSDARGDMSALLHAADQALYRAKALGRNRAEAAPSRFLAAALG